MSVVSEEKIARNTTDHQEFANRLERAVPRHRRRFLRHIIVRLRATWSNRIIFVAPIEKGGEHIARHVLKLSQFARTGAIEIKPAFLIADAVDDAAAFVITSAPDDAELSASKGHVAKLILRVVKSCAVTNAAVAALPRILHQKRPRFLDPGESQIMRL